MTNIKSKLRDLILLTFMLSLSVLSYGQQGSVYQVETITNSQDFTVDFQSAIPPVLTNYPQHGDVNVNFSGGFYHMNYAPDSAFVGLDTVSLEYWEGMIPFVKVKYLNYIFEVVDSKVTAEDDFYSEIVGATGITLSILDNDSTTSESLHISKIPISSKVIIQDYTDSTVTIDLLPSFEGIASFSYIVCDDQGACDNAYVRIYAVNEENLLTEDTAMVTTVENQPVTFMVAPAGFTIDVAPSQGTVSALDDLAFIYTPVQNTHGLDTFTFTRGDSISRTVIARVIELPTLNTYIVDDHVYTPGMTTVSFDVFANDISNNFPIDYFSTPDVGTLVHDSLGNFTFTPPFLYEGTTYFTYTTCTFGYCETGVVYIHIGNLDPNNGLLTTTKNRPVVINYQIPISNFDFYINTPPAHGTLSSFPGLDTLQIGCEDIVGHSMVLYSPDPDYIGEDQFELLYCVGNPLQCESVIVNVEVLDLVIDSTCICIDDCVWPGDANNDGMVNMKDLLTLGNNLGNAGNERPYPSLDNWYGQYCDNWTAQNFQSVNNLKHVDTDGDGFVTAEDTFAIDQFYNRVHSLMPENPLYFDTKIPVELQTVTTGPLDSGDLVVINYIVGEDDIPLYDVNGHISSFYFNTELVDSASIKFNYIDDSWLTDYSSTLDLMKVPYDGRLDGGLTRIDKNPKTGFGILATWEFIIEDDVIGIKSDGTVPLKLSAEENLVQLANGQIVKLADAELELKVNVKGVKSELNPDKLLIYPNPSNGLSKIHLNGQLFINKVEIYNTNGQQIRNINLDNAKSLQVDLTDQVNGIYFVKVYTDKGPIIKKLEVFN